MPKHMAPQIPVVTELSDDTGTVWEPIPMTTQESFTAQEVGVSIVGVFPSSEVVRVVLWLGTKEQCPVRQVTSFPMPTGQVVYDSHLGPFGGPNAVSVEQLPSGTSITRFDAFKITSSFLKISSDAAQEGQGLWMKVLTSGSERTNFLYSTYVKGYHGVHSRAGEISVTEGNKIGPVSAIRAKAQRAVPSQPRVVAKKPLHHSSKAKKAQKGKKVAGKKSKKSKGSSKNAKKPGKTAVKDATKLAKFFKDLRAAKAKK